MNMRQFNNKKIGFSVVLFAILFLMLPNGYTQNPKGFREMAIDMADKNVPIITYQKVKKVESKGKEIIYLDAREYEEYKISHIKGAVHVGYDDLKELTIKKMDRDAIYVVYCSVGYRSGKVGKKMMNWGFKSVFNLYGGIFDWANNNNPIVKGENKTIKVHPYNNKWGKWLRKELWEGI